LRDEAVAAGTLEQEEEEACHPKGRRWVKLHGTIPAFPSPLGGNSLDGKNGKRRRVVEG